MKIVCFLFALILSASGHAENTSTDNFSRKFKNLGFHTGSHTEFYDRMQIDEKGTTEKFGFNPLLGFSTDFELVENANEWHDKLLKLTGEKVAAKLRKGGYDGKGVQVINTASDVELGFNAPSVLEKKVRIAKRFLTLALVYKRRV